MSQDSEEDTPNSVVTMQPVHDVYLLVLTKLLEADGEHKSSMSMSFNIGGGLVYGQMISRAAWERAWIKQTREASEWVGDVVDQVVGLFDAEVGEEGHPSHFVHLRDATYLSGGVAHHLPLWRGPLAQIAGWSQTMPAS